MSFLLWFIHKLDYWIWYKEYRQRGLDKQSAKVKALWRIG